jgi:hypothetical protein
MLPDFPEVKRVVLKNLIGQTKMRAKADPLLGMMPPFIVHEGDRSILRREDGTEAVLELRKNPIKATVEITAEEMRLRGPSATARAITQLSEGLNEGMAKRTFQALEEAAESVGNSINANGPFTAEIYFAMLETMELHFRADGQWLGLKLIGHPDTVAKAELVIDAIKRDPELVTRRDSIVAQKREEWRVREAARKLVD